MSRYVSMDSIVKSAIIDTGDNTEHAYQSFLHWGFQCARDLSFDTALEIKTVRLTMSDAKTINLPNDLVDYTKVGVVIGDRVKVYIVNTRLEIANDVDECGNPVDKPTTNYLYGGGYLGSFGGYYFMNYLGGTIFGYGGTCNNPGYCVLDKARNQISFSSEVDKTDVYLEYITDGVNPDGESLVQRYCEQAVIYYILWKRKERSQRFPMTEKIHARKLYYNELRLARARLTAFSLEDFIASTRKGYLDRLQAPLFTNPTSEDVQTTVEACVDSVGVGFCEEEVGSPGPDTLSSIVSFSTVGNPNTPLTGSVDSILVDGNEILTSTIVFLGIVSTARVEFQQVIDNINAFSGTSGFTASFNDATNIDIKITAVDFEEPVLGLTPVLITTPTSGWSYDGSAAFAVMAGSLIYQLEPVPCTENSPESQPDGYERVYWGSKASPYIDSSSEVATLISAWAPDKSLDKFIDASDEYLYSSYPKTFGTTASFEVDGVPEVWTLIEIADFSDIYSTQSYYIYKSPAKKTGTIHVIILA